MGVPKFYRWMSERYPCLSEVIKEYQLPEFDNLYLDMNGIVHICSHPEDDNPHFRITEEKIFEDIFHYIEVLFRMIKPRKVFFMAIDGVAPRAKMNQQRGRRFRSAKEAEDLVKRAIQKGEILPTSERFDSNCITPGTPFMVRLQEQLKYFVVRKVSTDPLWQGPRIFLSGHQTPGEGEHKIMDFIRYERSQEGYDPNTRHCLYGLDADLIMLGLTSHEPHFSLLREEVRFGGKSSKNKRSTCAEDTTFHLLHLQLFREYLDYEFIHIKDKLPFEYDLEKIIDDWVLLGFIVGNDFIPHAPDMHIKNDALPMIWRTYMDVLSTLGGYLNEGGFLNLPRFEKFLCSLSQFDVQQFNDKYADLKWFAGKTGRKRGKTKFTCQKPRPKSNKFAMLDNTPDDDDDSFDVTVEDDDDVDDVKAGTESDSKEDLFTMEFEQHKRNYYMEKLNYTQVTPEVLQEQAHCYVTGIQWILHYYYNGVPSWGWYYPHHYAPFLSDVKNFSNMEIKLEYGEPFLPFQQLMAVLPAASKALLPACFQTLMTNEFSQIVDFYPESFEQDLNGKMQAWEAVVLIPFIDENRLLNAMSTVAHQMSDDERIRNRKRPCLMYQHTQESLGQYPSSNPAFPTILFNHAKLHEFDVELYRIKPKEIKKGLCDGIKMGVYYPGFPTLQHISHTTELLKTGVRVFQMNSRGESVILTITNQPDTDIDHVARDIVGRSIFVSWPHLFEAKVVGVSDGEVRYDLMESDGNNKSRGKTRRVEMNKVSLNDEQHKLWRVEISSIQSAYNDSKGIVIGDTKVLVYVRPMIGRKYITGTHGNITLEKQWSSSVMPFALQATVKDIATHDPSFEQFRTVADLYPIDSDVFMLGNPHYGSMGKVLEHDTGNSGRIRVELTVKEEPNMLDIVAKQQKLSLNYVPGYVAGKRLGVNPHLVSRITGTVFLAKGSSEMPRDGKTNIGLNLKFNKRNEEVPGYTKKSDDGWAYSHKTTQELELYMKKFPELFDYLASNSGNNDMFYESDVFPINTADKIKELAAFIKELPCQNAPRLAMGSDILDEPIIELIQKETDTVTEKNKKKKRSVKVQVRPHLLHRPLSHQTLVIPDVTAVYLLFDRVIHVRLGYSVELGLRGTVTGITKGEKELDTVFDVVFDEAFQGGISLRCRAGHGYRLPPAALINISHGLRKEEARERGIAVETVVSEWSSEIKMKPNKDNNRSWRNTSQSSLGSYSSHQNGFSKRRDYSSDQKQFGATDYIQKSGYSQPNYQEQATKDQHPPTKSQPEKGNSDFANMWRELKSSMESSNQSDVAVSKTPSKVSVINQPAEKPLETEDRPATETAVNINEFMAMFKSLQTSEQQPLTSSGDKNYGRKVSVEELFKTAAQQSESAVQLQRPSDFTLAESPKEKPSSQQDTQQPQKRATKHKPKTPPQTQHRYQQQSGHSAIQDLHNWSLSVRLPLPKYEYVTSYTGGVTVYLATVTLGSGIKIQGSFTRSKELASESAAATAIFHMGNQTRCQPWMNMSPMFAPPGGFGSANSAFRPVNPQYAGVAPHPSHNRPYRGQQDNRSHIQSRVRNNSQSQKSEGQKTEYNEGMSPPKPPSASNPFIPLQVTKNQKTPQKKKESGSVVNATSTDCVDMATSPRQPADVKQKKEKQEPPTTSPLKPEQRPRKSKRPRSRLAANFGNQ